MSFIYKYENIINLLIFITAVILIVMRHVDFFISPRFWAEEATQYFYDAYMNGPSALVQAHKGYYSIVPTVSAYFATLVPLEHAPLVTTIFAFFVQVIPFYLIYISRSEYFNTSLKKLLASLIILFVVHTPEIWLNAITSQFHFVIIVFILLLENKDNIPKSKRYWFYFLTLVSGLSGVPANILAPLFLYNYLITKQKENLYLFGIFILTTSIHLVFILTADRIGQIHDDITFYVIGNIFVSLFQYPIFYSWKIGIETIIILPLFYIIIKCLSPKKYFEIFFVSAFLLTTIMILTSWGMKGGIRYMYAPSIIMILGLLVAIFDISLSKVTRGVLGIYVALALFSGIKNFPLIDGQFYSKNWKNWHDQALLYKAHKVDKIVLYPPMFKISLPRKQ